jgi:hypothetical protein
MEFQIARFGVSGFWSLAACYGVARRVDCSGLEFRLEVARRSPPFSQEPAARSI